MAYNLLKGKKGIIFGALDDKSIAWKVAEQAHEEGAVFTLSNTETALRFGMTNELAEKTGSVIIPADATNVDDLYNVLKNRWKFLVEKLIFYFTPLGCRLMFAKRGFIMTLTTTIFKKHWIFLPSLFIKCYR